MGWNARRLGRRRAARSRGPAGGLRGHPAVPAGTGTLTFTTSAPENAYDETTATVETGTVSDGTGDLAGHEGTIEMTYILLYGGAYENGTYTATLEYVG